MTRTPEQIRADLDAVDRLLPERDRAAAVDRLLAELGRARRAEHAAAIERTIRRERFLNRVGFWAFAAFVAVIVAALVLLYGFGIDLAHL